MSVALISREYTPGGWRLRSISTGKTPNQVKEKNISIVGTCIRCINLKVIPAVNLSVTADKFKKAILPYHHLIQEYILRSIKTQFMPSTICFSDLLMNYVDDVIYVV